MKSLLFLMLCCMATGCATSRNRINYDQIPLPSPEAPQAERQQFYDSHKVVLLSPYEIAVGGSSDTYDNTGSYAYLRSYDRDRMMKSFPDPIADRRKKILVPLVIPAAAAVGCVVGFIVGALVPQQVDPGTYAGGGAGVGAVIGVLLTMGGYALISHNAERNAERVSQGFNHDLFEHLDLQAGPEPGGAKAGVNMKF